MVYTKNRRGFFGTDRGIISYRSDANKAEEEFGDVYAFPNPVRPGYEGKITITGLIRDANVKITDIAGNLVYETKTLGGQAIWDGKNFDGRKAASGVYLIFCTNEDGSKTHITKLLFLK
ncbi:MAG: T9SS type A sorting domain-containing protein [Bacteroidales bacterium]|nr:T9SS type A sorting domain-containing protein [Bacteroidales bacterium]